MNKQELIVAVVGKTELDKKVVASVVDSTFEEIAGVLASGDNVSLYGFGNFEVRETAARKGRNPQTGEEIEIPAGKKPAFKPAKALKEAVK